MVGGTLGEQYPRTNAHDDRAKRCRSPSISSVRSASRCSCCSAPSACSCSSRARTSRICCSRAAPGAAQEVAIRAALGAGRARLVRQLLTESLVLAAIGCALGLGIAKWMVDVIVALTPADVPRMDQVRLDVRVAAFAAALSMLTALLFGIVPALSLSRSGVHDALADASRGSSSGTGRRRLRGALVIAEVALAVVLLVGAGLLVRSFITLINVDPGFTRKNVLALQVFTYGEKYRTPDQQAAFYRQALDRLSVAAGRRKGRGWCRRCRSSPPTSTSRARFRSRVAPPHGPTNSPARFLTIATGVLRRHARAAASAGACSLIPTRLVAAGCAGQRRDGAAPLAGGGSDRPAHHGPLAGAAAHGARSSVSSARCVTTAWIASRARRSSCLTRSCRSDR